MLYLCKNCDAELDDGQAFSFRTTGKAHILCKHCKDIAEEKMIRQRTPYICTSYVSVNAIESVEQNG